MSDVGYQDVSCLFYYFAVDLLSKFGLHILK